MCTRVCWGLEMESEDKSPLILPTGHNTEPPEIWMPVPGRTPEKGASGRLAYYYFPQSWLASLPDVLLGPLLGHVTGGEGGSLCGRRLGGREGRQEGTKWKELTLHRGLQL